MIGKEIHKLAKKLFFINRSITGEGVRKTLLILKKILPELKIIEVASGSKVFDWTVPKEWRVRKAYIITPSGKKICQFSHNNLHLVGYSIPINKKISFEELNKHLHSLPNQPDVIPYITSYYNERWGFCISHKERKMLEKGTYEVLIDSELFNGSLTYGELILKGKEAKEIFLSTNICHPSMGNNELSGLTVTTFLAQWLYKLKKRTYTYRIVFLPETIGSITYLSKNIDFLKQHVIAGFNVSCVGDNRTYSYAPSRNGDTLSDKVAKHVLKWTDKNFVSYNWSHRGCDLRQYCAPGIDLPIASIMRTAYGEYPEYHTSSDDLINVVTPEGLEGGFKILKLAIEAIENNCYPQVMVYCEPHLGKLGLYPDLSTKDSFNQITVIMDLISWSDGKHSLIDIADKIGVPVWDLYSLLNTLKSHSLLSI